MITYYKFTSYLPTSQSYCSSKCLNILDVHPMKGLDEAEQFQQSDPFANYIITSLDTISNVNALPDMSGIALVE